MQSYGLPVLLRCVIFATLATSGAADDLKGMSHSMAQSKLPKADGVVDKTKSCLFTLAPWPAYGFVDAFFSAAASTNPDVACKIWFVTDRPDTVPPSVIATHKPDSFRFITVSELQKSSSFDLEELAMKFDVVDFASALKPLAFKYLFNELEMDKAIYLDTGVWVLGQLDDVFSLLQTHLFVASAPVPVRAISDSATPKPPPSSSPGMANLGFVALSRSSRSIEFLEWWHQHSRYYGYSDKPLHFERNWVHYVMTSFGAGEYYIVHDARYNSVHFNGGGINLVGGQPCIGQQRLVLLQLSGLALFEDYDLSSILGGQGLIPTSAFSDFSVLFAKYISHVSSFDLAKFLSIPYGYSFFDDGSKVPDLFRKFFQEVTDSAGYLAPSPWGVHSEMRNYFLSFKIKPFAAGTISPLEPTEVVETLGRSPRGLPFIDYLLAGPYIRTVDSGLTLYFSQLEDMVFRTRPDVKKVFPDPIEKHYLGFKNWFKDSNNIKYLNIPQPVLDIWLSNLKKSVVFRSQLAAKPPPPLSVTLLGWANGVFGVGVSAARIYSNLKAAGIPVKVTDAYGASVHKTTRRVPYEDMTRLPSSPINLVVMNAADTPNLKIVYPLSEWSTHYNIAVWAWELSTFPDQYIREITHYDMIFAPTNFIKNAIMSSPLYNELKRPVETVPFALPPVTASDPSARPPEVTLAGQHVVRRKTFVFLGVFDYYSSFERKNPVASVKAFRDAFPVANGDDVALFLKASTAGYLFRNERIELMRAIDNDPRIRVIEGALPDDDMDALKRRADCYLSLHRSEGYGLNLIESMASMIPTIATDYSGNADFFACSPLVRKAHYPIGYDLIPVRQNFEYKPYADINGSVWADPWHDDAVRAIRKAASRPDRGVLKAAADALMGCFGQTAVANILKEHTRHAYDIWTARYPERRRKYQKAGRNSAGRRQ